MPRHDPPLQWVQWLAFAPAGSFEEGRTGNVNHFPTLLFGSLARNSMQIEMRFLVLVQVGSTSIGKNENSFISQKEEVYSAPILDPLQSCKCTQTFKSQHLV